MNQQNVVMLILGTADGAPSPFDNQYLVEYDPTREGEDPQGRELIAHLITTADKSKAKVFSGLTEAFETWRLSHGVREDGNPNRPLTAFTVTYQNTLE